jgi:hypothetical protein
MELMNLFTRLPALALLAAGVVAGLALPAQADEQCGAPDSFGARQCSSGLSADKVRQMAVAQEQPNWCWAASISMIFAHHGYRVPQQEIVKGAFGVATALPAPSGETMTNVLSVAWIDQDAKPFRPSALASDAFAKRYQVSNDQVLAELAAGRPLLIGASRHAVVLVGLEFQRLAGGAVRITSGTVIDPQPGRGIRPMLTAELRPTYVAAVRVAAAGNPVRQEQHLAEVDARADLSVLR